MPKTIFYSWQSDLPNNLNRSFILDCLEKSVRGISSQGLALDFDVDRGSENKSSVKKELISKFTSAIKAIHENAPRLARKVWELIVKSNPGLAEAINAGERRFSLYIKEQNAETLQELVSDPALAGLISLTSNGNLFSNNGQSGTFWGFDMKLTNEFAKMVA